MKVWCAILTIWFFINTYFVFDLYKYHRQLEKQINKAVQTNIEILSNQGFIIELGKAHLDVTKANMEMFTDILPRPECVNLYDEHQFREIIK